MVSGPHIHCAIAPTCQAGPCLGAFAHEIPSVWNVLPSDRGGLATSFPSGLCSLVTLAVRSYLTTMLKKSNFTTPRPKHTHYLSLFSALFSP